MMWYNDFMWAPEAHFRRWGFWGYSARYLGNSLNVGNLSKTPRTRDLFRCRRACAPAVTSTQ
jgi:hypothetical protein